MTLAVKPIYRASADSFIIGNHFKKGAIVPISAEQAKYLVAPYGDAVYVDEPKEPAPATPAKDK